MERASTLVRAARKSRLLTQVDLAQKAHIHQSNLSEIENGRDLSVSTLDRLLTATGHGLYALPVRRADASETARALQSKLKSGNREGALRVLIQLNDNLVAEHGLLRGVLGLAEPESTGRPEWDAALAGLVAWRLTEEGLPTPTWVEDDRFFLRRPRTLDVDPADPIPTPEDIPHEFARRGVLVWADTFESI
jgi:transcriptional regulator with XRE-family HTH domain